VVEDKVREDDQVEAFRSCWDWRQLLEQWANGLTPDVTLHVNLRDDVCRYVGRNVVPQVDN
jgi:hypothetical protein